jgi:hypothetical protein
VGESQSKLVIYTRNSPEQQASSGAVRLYRFVDEMLEGWVKNTQCLGNITKMYPHPEILETLFKELE